MLALDRVGSNCDGTEIIHKGCTTGVRRAKEVYLPVIDGEIGLVASAGGIKEFNIAVTVAYEVLRVAGIVRNSCTLKVKDLTRYGNHIRDIPVSIEDEISKSDTRRKRYGGYVRPVKGSNIGGSVRNGLWVPIT